MAAQSKKKITFAVNIKTMSETTLLNLRDYLFETLTESNMLWLAKQLLEHVKTEEKPLEQYTIEEIDSMLDAAENDFETGNYLTNEEVFNKNK